MTVPDRPGLLPGLRTFVLSASLIQKHTGTVSDTEATHFRKATMILSTVCGSSSSYGQTACKLISNINLIQTE